jgi:hypothetical protein
MKSPYEHVEKKSAQALNVQTLLKIQLMKTVRPGELSAKLAKRKV